MFFMINYQLKTFYDTSEGPEKGCRDCEGTEACLLERKIERARTVQPGEGLGGISWMYTNTQKGTKVTTDTETAILSALPFC